jgi:hypothetical protein
MSPKVTDLWKRPVTATPPAFTAILLPTTLAPASLRPTAQANEPSGLYLATNALVPEPVRTAAGFSWRQGDQSDHRSPDRFRFRHGLCGLQWPGRWHLSGTFAISVWGACGPSRRRDKEMQRRIWAAAAVAAGIALGGSAAAGDDAVRLGRFQPHPDGFAGAVQSAAAAEGLQASADDDTELVHGRWRRFGPGWGWGGWGWPGAYRGFGLSVGFSSGWGGWGWPGYGWGGWGRPGWGWGGAGLGWGGTGWGWSGYGLGWGYSSFYRPGFALSVYSAPRIFASSAFTYYPGDFFCLMGGTTAAVQTPVTTLGLSTASAAVATPLPGTANGTTARQLPPPTPLGQPVQPLTPTAPAANGTFHYDGGPSTPVPMPIPDTPGTTPPRIEPIDQPASIPISLPVKKPALKYPAYGKK